MRFVVLVGSPGVGKTEVAEGMLEHLEGWDYLAEGRDGGHRMLADKLKRAACSTILEVQSFTPILRKALLGQDATVVEVRCTEPERARRLGIDGAYLLPRPLPRQQHHLDYDTTGGRLPDSIESGRLAGRPTGRHAVGVA